MLVFTQIFYCSFFKCPFWSDTKNFCLSRFFDTTSEDGLGFRIGSCATTFSNSSSKDLLVNKPILSSFIEATCFSAHNLPRSVKLGRLTHRLYWSAHTFKSILSNAIPCFP